MIQEKSHLCFYLYHTTCRNRILAKKTTRKMERERYCELIWCSNADMRFVKKFTQPFFLAQKNYTLKVRKLQLFLLTKKQRKCINISNLSNFSVRIPFPISTLLKCNTVPQLIVDSKSFFTQNAHEGY